MTGLPALFSALIRGERPAPDAPAFPAHDEFTGHCDHCRRVTIWKVAAVVAGVTWYMCQSCKDVRR